MRHAMKLAMTRASRRAFVRRRVWALLPRAAGRRNQRELYEAARREAVAQWYRRAA
jgi:hypothetical protein